MIASTSHDMRTPINTIKAMHTLIKQQFTNETLINWVTIADCNVEYLLSLISDTLDYFQLKSGSF